MSQRPSEDDEDADNEERELNEHWIGSATFSQRIYREGITVVSVT